MEYIRDIWRVVVTKPFTLLFYCYFQPSKLGEEFRRYRPLVRTLPCLRLALPLFLVSYPIAFMLKLAFSLFLPSSMALVGMGPLLLTLVLRLFVIAIISTAISIVGDVVAGTMIGFAMGVMAGFTWPIIATVGLGAAFAFLIKSFLPFFMVPFSTFTMVIDLLLGIGIFTHQSIGTIFFGSAAILAFFFVIVGCVNYTTSRGDTGYIRQIGWQIPLTLMDLLIVMSLSYGMIAHNFVWNLVAKIVSGLISLLLSTSILLAAFKFMTSGGDMGKKEEGQRQIQASLGTSIIVVAGTIVGINSLTIMNSYIAILFVITYLLISYRFLLYPFYNLSMLRSYLISREDCARVFSCLERSPLYWDELTPFHLPYLKKCFYLPLNRTLQEPS